MAGRSKAKTLSPEMPKKHLGQRIKKDLKKNYLLYLLLLPGILILIFFKIGPVGAMVIAFQNFSAFKGIVGSKWVDFKILLKFFRIRIC